MKHILENASSAEAIITGALIGLVLGVIYKYGIKPRLKKKPKNQE
jgi:hypothetical protein